MSIFLPILLAAVLAGLVLAYFYHEHVEERRLKLRVRKMFASQFFEELLPLLCNAKYHSVEQVSVDKAGVVVRYLNPSSPESVFLMKSRGFRNLTGEQLEALRTLLEQCLPKLADSKRYRVYRKPVYLLNGDLEYVYEYIITNDSKARLSRSSYYDGSLEAPLG